MSTCGNIAIAINGVDAKVIYNHFDSYPKYLGAMLKCYYFNKELVEELVNNGDVSFVSKFVGEKHDFDNRPKDWCNFYGRDRGESNTEANTRSTDSNWSGNGAEYDYLHKDGKWFVRHSGSLVDGWHVLTNEECGITMEDRINARQEVFEYLNEKKKQHKDLDKMLDDFLAKF